MGRKLVLSFFVFAALAALLLALSSPPEVEFEPASVPAGDGILERGKYLIYAGGCITCHTDEEGGGAPLAGGRALATPFGVFYSPNITPDEDTGIGAWSDADFVRALKLGVSPRGEHYYPAFPYPAYTGVVVEDLLAMKAYLSGLAPVRMTNKSHDLPFYLDFRPALRLWKLLHLRTADFSPDPGAEEGWNRGAYLVRHLGHCGECHTPRTVTGGLNSRLGLAGNPHGPDGDAVPNITQDRADGVGKWTLSDLEQYLESGMLPDGDFAGGAMAQVIDDNTSHLSKHDRRAIAAYLKSLPPVPALDK